MSNFKLMTRDSFIHYLRKIMKVFEVIISQPNTMLSSLVLVIMPTQYNYISNKQLVMLGKSVIFHLKSKVIYHLNIKMFCEYPVGQEVQKECTLIFHFLNEPNI